LLRRIKNIRKVLKTKLWLLVRTQAKNSYWKVLKLKSSKKFKRLAYSIQRVQRIGIRFKSMKPSKSNLNERKVWRKNSIRHLFNRYSKITKPSILKLFSKRTTTTMTLRSKRSRWVTAIAQMTVLYLIWRIIRELFKKVCSVSRPKTMTTGAC